MKNSHLLGAIGAVLCTITTLSAQAVTVPVGVNPGETYQLVFVTAGTTDALSTDIADYNSFVQTQAALNPTLTGTDIGVTYTAIGSTSTIDANVNAVVSGSVYLVDGSALVATSFSDFWDGTLSQAINKDQHGSTLLNNTWTGSEADGTAASGQELGLATGSTFFGSSLETDATWIHAGAFGNKSVLIPMYALSSVITAPVPVPAAVWLFCSGLLGLIGVARRKKSA